MEMVPRAQNQEPIIMESSPLPSNLTCAISQSRTMQAADLGCDAGARLSGSQLERHGLDQPVGAGWT
jgi:hypothetical protein